MLKYQTDENKCNAIRLMLGVYKMHAADTPVTGAILSGPRLEYIHEAHIYLRYRAAVFDFATLLPPHFISDLIYETAIRPEDITHYKVQLHQKLLADWLG